MNKKQIIATVLALVIAVGARGDLVIYTLSQTTRLIGGGTSQSIAVSGYGIFDVDNGIAYSVGHYKLKGTIYFTLENVPDFRLYQVDGPKGQAYTVFMSRGISNSGGQYIDANGFGYGVNASLKISNARIVSFPRTMTGGPRAVTIPTNSAPVFENDTASYVFASKQTLAANASSETALAAANQFAAQFQALGYTQLP